MGLAPTDLPIEAVIDDVRASLADTGSCVLGAEPGAGKSTIVPLRLLDEPWLRGRRIIVLEPRRMAARAVARRMASLLGEEPGGTVGWITRDDRAVGPDTRITVVTEGVLTARLVDDPGLSGIGLVVLDEFHERSLPGDTALALLLHGRRRAEHDARMLVMSATLDPVAVATHLGGDGEPAPVVTCPGRTHPIELVWRPRPKRAPLVPAVVRAVDEALRGPGDVLVFLPGVGEIRRCHDALSPRDDIVVMPLHGSLPAAEQDAALIARATRRVVLATNIAETSLTVDGITAIVDAGLARVPRFDPATGLTRLRTVACDRSSAEQRAGRAGRLGPGIAIRLWSKAEHGTRVPRHPPEITEVDLAGLVLDLARRDIHQPGDLPFLDPPPDEGWAATVALLQRLGALDPDGGVTERGRAMADLPVHPRLARPIVAGRHRGLACVLAALLDDRDVLRGRPDDLPLGFDERVALLLDPRAADHPAADRRAVDQTRRRAERLARRADTELPVAATAAEVGATLALGFPDRVTRAKAGQRGDFVTADGRTFRVDRRRDGRLADAAGMVAVEVGGRPGRRTAPVRRAAPLEARLDHLVYATPDLAATVADITETWGVTPAAGGRHDGLGTHNALLAIGGGAYLELIGPDPDQPDPGGPRPFGVDDVTEPRLVTWAASVPDLDGWLAWCAARKVDPGPAVAMQRTRPDGSVLAWRLTLPPDEGDGVVPFLIEWPGSTPAQDAPRGVELFAFSLQHPDRRVSARLREYALPHPVDLGPVGLRATLLTPSGLVELSS